MKQNKIIKCRDITNTFYDVPAEQLVWRPAVYGVIIRDNQILLSKQFNRYDFPGGGMEKGETIEEALIREVKEETGLDVTVGRQILTGTAFFRTSFGVDQQNIQIYHLCEVIGGELTTKFFDEPEKEYAELAEWASLDDPASLQFIGSTNTRPALEKALAMLRDEE